MKAGAGSRVGDGFDPAKGFELEEFSNVEREASRSLMGPHLTGADHGLPTTVYRSKTGFEELFTYYQGPAVRTAFLAGNPAYLCLRSKYLAEGSLCGIRPLIVQRRSPLSSVLLVRR